VDSTTARLIPATSKCLDDGERVVHADVAVEGRPGRHEEQHARSKLPAPANLPEIAYLPDPFRIADGTRMTSRDQSRPPPYCFRLNENVVGFEVGPPLIVASRLPSARFEYRIIFGKS
jgi:hypothetical protein